jgi:hypothetical protein
VGSYDDRCVLASGETPNSQLFKQSIVLQPRGVAATFRDLLAYKDGDSGDDGIQGRERDLGHT